MKDKIFQLLKTTYSSLGLGDAVLTAHAQVLDAMGIVTDENINSVVAGQKGILEAFQKNADERATMAQKKASEKLQAELEALKATSTASAEEKQKLEAQIKELEAKIKTTQQTQPEPQPFNLEENESFKTMKASFEAQTKAMQDAMSKLTENLTALQTENNQFKQERASAERAQFITSKAKELGIPEWRIAEGFGFAPEATEEAIVTTLTGVANNIKAHVLPDKKTTIPLSQDGKIDMDLVKSVASSITKGI